MRTPDKEPAETPEEIAERIIREIFVIDSRTALSELHPAYSKDYELILSALRNERERAAKLADSEAQQATRDEALSNDDADRGRCHAAMSIAKAIREGK